MKNKKTISDIIDSARYYSVTDDSLKDEDNVAWIMELQENEIKEWVKVLKWIRVADRLLERDVFQKSINNFSYTFKDFISDWNKLRATGEIDNNSLFASLFKELKLRWDKEKLIEENLKIWDLYLDSLVKYVKPNVTIHDMTEYENALYGLSGTFFQAFPFAPNNYMKEIGILGTIDQFYNNLRDLYEDITRGICYFPISLLKEFELHVNDMENQIIEPDIQFIRLNEYLLSFFVSKLKTNIAPLLSANGLHHSWQLLLKNVLSRHSRIEYVFRLCNYNAKQFNVKYWNFVRADLNPDISSKFLTFKSTFREF